MTGEADFTRAVGRIVRTIPVLAAAGAISALLIAGWGAAAGFLLGAAASYFNFRWLQRVVDNLGRPSSGVPPRARVAVFLGLRYAALALGGYVILKSSVISLPAALAGLFVSVAAVILEILFELVYARI